jgi:hypothetical protein
MFVGHQVGGAHHDLSDDAIIRLGDQRKFREIAGVGTNRRDQRRDLGIVERGELETIDRREVVRNFGADPDAAGDPGQIAQPAVPAVAACRPSGTGRRCSTGRMYRSTISRDPFTPNSVKRNVILRRCAARISSFVARSQSSRLNGPIAFFRVV